MPTIPQRTTARPLPSPNLGRETAAIPGIGEQVQLQQFDRIVQSGTQLADTLLARKETRDREASDLKVNEGKLAFMAASRESFLEIEQLTPQQAEEAATGYKKRQDEIYKNSIADLSPEEVERFDNLVAPIAFEYNAKAAKFAAESHNKRILQNYNASAEAEELMAYDSVANRPVFNEHMESSWGFRDEVLRLGGANETARANEKKKFISSSLKQGISLMAPLSLSNAEDWLKQSMDDGQLLPQHERQLTAALDKYKSAQNADEMLVWSQNTIDSLVDVHGRDQKTIFDDIERNYSGKQETALKNEYKIRTAQESAQDAANQRSLKQRAKAITDDSVTRNEAWLKVNELMADPSATPETAKQAGSYIDFKFEKSAGKRKTNTRILDEVYTRINKTFNQTAKPNEIIDSVEEMLLEYSDRLSPTDQKNASDYYRNGGFFGRTAYNDLLNSYAGMIGKTPTELKKDTGLMTGFADFIEYSRMRLDPEKAASPFDIQKIGAQYLQLEEVEGRIPSDIIFGTDYQDAVKEGREDSWVPTLRAEHTSEAKTALAAVNAERSSQGLPPIPVTQRNLSVAYKLRILGLSHKEER